MPATSQCSTVASDNCETTTGHSWITDRRIADAAFNAVKDDIRALDVLPADVTNLDTRTALLSSISSVLQAVERFTTDLENKNPALEDTSRTDVEIQAFTQSIVAQLHASTMKDDSKRQETLDHCFQTVRMTAQLVALQRDFLRCPGEGYSKTKYLLAVDLTRTQREFCSRYEKKLISNPALMLDEKDSRAFLRLLLRIKDTFPDSKIGSGTESFMVSMPFHVSKTLQLT